MAKGKNFVSIVMTMFIVSNLLNGTVSIASTKSNTDKLNARVNSKRTAVKRALVSNAATDALTREKDKIKGVIVRNIKASNDKDVALYMSTVYHEEPMYSKTKEAMESNFKTAKISYKLDKCSITTIKDNLATVDLTLTTYNKTDKNYKSIRIVVRNQLKKQKGNWKILKSQLIDLE